MARLRLAATAAATLALLVGTMGMAFAVHEDVIEEKIAASDVPVALQTVADGFTSPVWAINAPGDTRRLFVVDQVGTITAIRLGGKNGIPVRLEVLDIGVDGLDLLVPLGAFGPGTFDERGLLGLAFHPDYAANGLLYTYSSEPATGAADFTTLSAGLEANHQSVVREWTVRNPRNPNSVVDTSSSRILMTVDQPQFNHNGGALNFGPDRMLYVSLGDGGAADDQGDGHVPGGNGQSLAEGNVLGKILRIDPTGSNSANGQYGIPADNPFVGTDGADEIFAYGFRNPFRFSFDSETGELIAADVGQNDIEEVDVVVAGGNYGWPVKEGSFLFDMNGDDPGFTTEFSPGDPPGLIDPIAEYDHDEGISISGGFVYHGKRIGPLQGSYVFGDWLGRLFHLEDDGSIEEISPIGRDGVGVQITGFGQDRVGELYVLGQPGSAPVGNDGVVMRLVRAVPPRHFSTDLDGANEIPPVVTDASGSASFRATGDGKAIRFSLAVENIEGATMAHIHLGGPDENGPVVAFLFGPVEGLDVGAGRTIAKGVLTASDLVGPLEGMSIRDLLAEMHRGTAYVNVHTVDNPAGEIRGQIATDG